VIEKIKHQLSIVVLSTDDPIRETIEEIELMLTTLSISTNEDESPTATSDVSASFSILEFHEDISQKLGHFLSKLSLENELYSEQDKLAYLSKAIKDKAAFNTIMTTSGGGRAFFGRGV